MESGKRDPQDGTKLVYVLAQIGKVLALYFIEYNLLTAAAVITILPILVIFIVLQRWVVQAVVMSGLKGSGLRSTDEFSLAYGLGRG